MKAPWKNVAKTAKNIILSVRAHPRAAVLWPVFISLISLVVIISTLVYYGQSPFKNLDASAASYVSYGGGQVAIETAYFDGTKEVPNSVAAPNQNIVVRLKYSNTGGLQAQGTSINFPFPTGFGLVPGSIRNVLAGTETATLSDSLVTNNTLKVSPTAGFYDNSNSQISGVLDIGKKKYIRVITCGRSGQSNETYAAVTGSSTLSASDSSNNTCSSAVGGSFISGYDIPILNKRFLRLGECLVGGSAELFAQTATNTALTSPTDATGNICSTSVGGTFTKAYDINLLAGRYARLQTCNVPNESQELMLSTSLNDAPLNPGDATGNTCSTLINGSSFVSGSDIDLRDTENSSGYIEFQMTAAASSSCYQITATMTSNSFDTISSSDSCGIKVQSISSFGDGQVTFSKIYWDGINELNTLKLPISSTATIRLKYNNTSSQPAYGVSIADTFDTSTFAYVTGSAKNCQYNITPCTTLADGSFSTGTIRVGPYAGLIGYDASAQASNLENGRDRYVTMIQCSNGTTIDTFASSTSNSLPGITGSCSDYGLTGYNKLGSYSVEIMGKRYLNMLSCEKNGYYDTFIAQASSTSGGSLLQCSQFGLNGYTSIPAFSIDLRGNTQLNLRRCAKNGNQDTYEAAASTVSGASNLDCWNKASTGYSENGGRGLSVLNTGNGYGYIEYKIQLITGVSRGTYGTNATLLQQAPTSTVAKSCNNGNLLMGDGNCGGWTPYKYAHVANRINYNDSALPIGTTFVFNDDPNWAQDNSNTAWFTVPVNPGDQLNYRMCISENGGLVHFATRMWKAGTSDPLCPFGYQPQTVPATLECRPIGGGSWYPDQWADFGAQCSDNGTLKPYWRLGNYDNLTTTLTFDATSAPVSYIRAYWYNTYTWSTGGTTWNGYSRTFDEIGSQSSNVIPMGYYVPPYPGACPEGFTATSATTCSQAISNKLCPTGSTLQNDGNCLYQRQVVYTNSATGPVFDQQVIDPGFGLDNGWTLVNGSITNSWNGQIATLADSLFSGSGIAVSPSAGLFGLANDLASGTLQYPRIPTFSYTNCEKTISGETRTDQYSTDITGSENDPKTCTQAGSPTSNTVSLNITGFRYINNANCSRNFVTSPSVNESYAGDTWSATNQTANNTSCVDENYSALSYNSLDVLNNRYLLSSLCGIPKTVNGQTIIEYTNVFAVSNSPTAFPACTGEYAGVLNPQTYIADLYDSSQGTSGTINYSVTKPGVCPEGYVPASNATQCILQGLFFSSINAPAANTMTVELICDSIKPSAGYRDVTLSDAELRTDQDFTCNYQAQICPVIFQDANLNQRKDDLETLYDGFEVKLFRSKDNTEVATLNSNNQSQQCFTGLASGEIYKVVVPAPPSPYSTTGGDETIVEASVLEVQRFAYFGYSEGGVLLDAADQVFFPAISTSNVDTEVTTDIPYVEVRDLRLAQAPWSVSASISNFNGVTYTSRILPIAGRVTTRPKTVTVTSENGSIIMVGDPKTLQSTNDTSGIFNTGNADGNGQFSIPVGLDYSVPAYTPVDTYQATVTFTLI